MYDYEEDFNLITYTFTDENRFGLWVGSIYYICYDDDLE